MSLTINTNAAAVTASYNLSRNNSALQKSLSRLSSGKRIVQTSDDAGGLAVSMKLNASINRMQEFQITFKMQFHIWMFRTEYYKEQLESYQGWLNLNR